MDRITLAAIALCLGLAPAARADVTLVEDGRPKAVIHATAAVMAPADPDLNALKGAAREAEVQRRRLRESVKDLAACLHTMSGATVEVVTRAPAKDDPRVPILVGAPAAEAFGPLKKSAPYKQGFRLVVGPKGVGFVGESDLATSYAIYELLDRLGCRWYLPGDLGTEIPRRPTVRLADLDVSSAPATVYRGVWYADDAFRRRNRHGGLLLQAGHALEMYVTKEERQKHPEWVAEVGGKPHPHRLKWSSPTLADAVAEKILARHAHDPAPSYSLSPDDGVDFDESKEDKAIDAGDYDPTFQTVSLTDRLLVLCNRIATKVTAKYPDVRFGVLAYAQYTRPPVREKVHPSIVPQIAPIALARYHPVTDEQAPGTKELRALVAGWAKAAPELSIYFYAYNLAEPAAPMPMLARWSADVPFVLAHRGTFWQPETMPNFETHAHAHYLANRLAWDPAQKSADIIAEMNARLYGHAAAPMTAYWKYVDDVWVTTPEYSGCGFGYLRRWPTERLEKARQLLDAARAACKTPTETRRVALADDSLKLFEQFMQLRRDLADGRLTTLAADAARWRKQIEALADKHKESHAFGRPPWAKETAAGGYFGQFYQQTYDDATRIAKGFELLTPRPLRQFRFQADRRKQGEAGGWAKAEFDDRAWRTTDVARDTWSTIGHYDYMGSLWYRTEVEVPDVMIGKKVFLWLGATDGSARVFVNGRHVPYTDAKGKTADRFTGYCQPASFDITAAVRPGVPNRIALLCTREALNEVGTGGLLAPVLLYSEK